MATPTYNTIEKYHQLPIAAVESNEPYSVGNDPHEAEIRKQAKTDFISSNEQWPEVNFPLLSVEDLREAERALLSMLNAIIDDTETSDAIKNVAYEQIAIKLAEVYRHLEVARGLGHAAALHELSQASAHNLESEELSERDQQVLDQFHATTANRELSRERAGNMTMEIFGEPDKEIFDQFLAKDRRRARQALESGDELTAQVAREFLSMTGDVDETLEDNSNSYELKDETVEIIRGDLEKLFPGLDEFLAKKIEGNISAQDSLPHFNELLAIVDLIEKGWSSVSSDGAAAETKGNLKKIVIGRNRADFTPESIKGVPVHEGLVHAVRSQNASEQADPLKRRALPGNLLMEEGLATSIQQIVTGEKAIAGVPYYMSLGLQLGLDTATGEKRTFRQTHEIMWRRALLLKTSEHGKISEQDISKTKGTAYQTVIRTTRGNSLDARDISYFEGGRKASQWLNEIAQLDEDERLKKLRWVLSGKFDPTNPVQAELFDESAETN